MGRDALRPKANPWTSGTRIAAEVIRRRGSLIGQGQEEVVFDGQETKLFSGVTEQGRPVLLFECYRGGKAIRFDRQNRTVDLPEDFLCGIADKKTRHSNTADSAHNDEFDMLFSGQ